MTITEKLSELALTAILALGLISIVTFIQQGNASLLYLSESALSMEEFKTELVQFRYKSGVISPIYFNTETYAELFRNRGLPLSQFKKFGPVLAEWNTAPLADGHGNNVYDNLKSLIIVRPSPETLSVQFNIPTGTPLIIDPNSNTFEIPYVNGTNDIVIGSMYYFVTLNGTYFVKLISEDSTLHKFKFATYGSFNIGPSITKKIPVSMITNDSYLKKVRFLEITKNIGGTQSLLHTKQYNDLANNIIETDYKVRLTKMSTSILTTNNFDNFNFGKDSNIVFTFKFLSTDIERKDIALQTPF